jgi:dienelactone hydrolase
MQTIDGIDYYEGVSDAQEAFAVRPPKGYPSLGKYKVLVIIHGVGERTAGPGTIENLKNVVLGFDYDGAGPLPRQYAIMTPESVANADRTGTILVIVTYPTEFNPNDFDYVLDQVELNYQVDRTREFILGFSLGGGAILRNITSSAVAARRLAGAFAAAPVNWAGNLQYVADSKLQLVGVTYETDPRVPSSNIKNVIAKLNALNPEIPGVLTVYPGNAHGGLNELLAGREMWDYIEVATTENRLKYPIAGSVKPPPVVVLPVPDFNIINEQVIKTTEFTFDASASKGATEYYWAVNREEPPWIGHIMEGGTVGGPLKRITNLQPGKYSVQLTINKSYASTKRYFTVKLDSTVPPPKSLVYFDSDTDMITWSDGSTEKGKVVFSGAKWVLTDSKGNPV